MNVPQFVGRAELQGYIHGPRIAEDSVRLLAYLDFARISVASTVPNRIADDAVRIEIVFDFRSVHSDAQIPIERHNRNLIRGVTTSLRDLGERSVAKPSDVTAHCEHLRLVP